MNTCTRTHARTLTKRNLIGKFTSPARSRVISARGTVPWRKAHYVEGTGGAALQLHRKRLTGLCRWTGAKQSWTRRGSRAGHESLLARSSLCAVNQKACIMHRPVPRVKLQGIISKSLCGVYKENMYVCMEDTRAIQALSGLHFSSHNTALRSSKRKVPDLRKT